MPGVSGKATLGGVMNTATVNNAEAQINGVDADLDVQVVGQTLFADPVIVAGLN